MSQTDICDGVCRCPAGCDFDELEIGTENQSFAALIRIPLQKIRCGKCGFSAEPAAGREGAIKAWNAASRAAHTCAANNCGKS